jgi:hypothetical protein
MRFAVYTVENGSVVQQTFSDKAGYQFQEGSILRITPDFESRRCIYYAPGYWIRVEELPDE